MSKGNILDLLAKEPNRWFSVKDLAKRLVESGNAISTSLIALRKDEEVQWRHVKSIAARRYEYKHKENLE